MLSFEQLQERVSKPLGIMKSPRVKRGLLMREFAKILKAFGSWVRPYHTTCMDGCDFCCYRMPILKSRFEFEFVQTAVQLNLTRTGPWLEKYGPVWDRFSKIFGPTSRATEDAWRGARIPCPLLENRRCAIYENRPSICRMRWTPEFFLADCFPGTPLFPMSDGATKVSAYEMSDPLIEMPRPRAPEPPHLKLVDNTLKDIDKWVYNYVGKPKPLIDALERGPRIIT